MKIVIDITEDAFLACKHWLNEGVAQWAETIIANGTPLPKGHGRLIDADELYEDFIDGTDEQIQNLRDDGFFDDIEKEKDRLFWETFYED